MKIRHKKRATIHYLGAVLNNNIRDLEELQSVHS